MDKKENVLTILSLGCGVQSSVIAEKIIVGEYEPVDHVIFADTGNEPKYVYRQYKYLADKLIKAGFPVSKVMKNKGLIRGMFEPDTRFATIPAYTLSLDHKKGRMRRQCTSEYKIAPIEKLIRELMLERGYAKRTKAGGIYINKKYGATIQLGITLDESQRMKDNPIPFLTNTWPLIDNRMTRLDCVNWLNDMGIPVPGKSSCIICPYHSRRAWLQMKEERMDDFDQAVEIDEFLRKPNKISAVMKADMFLYRDCVPLAKADLEGDQSQDDFFDLCEEGYCFV